MTTATRDGIYTASYLGISPALQQVLDESPSLQNLPQTARFFAAGIASGSFAAVVTQPVDTVKTRMQVSSTSNLSLTRVTAANPPKEFPATSMIARKRERSKLERQRILHHISTADFPQEIGAY